MLADEPTGNLDSKNGEAVIGLLQALHDEGSTVCMVTHDPRYAEHARREIRLFDGKCSPRTTSATRDKDLRGPALLARLDFETGG